jgi:ABC-type branched-subunit amino acid transport system substrate-binding protein
LATPSYEALEGSWCGMKSPVITAALTLSLTGQYERQGIEAAEGVRLWAQEADIRLILADDHGSRSMAIDTYAGWIDGVDLLLGPYASGLVRAVAPLVRDAGRILWNHGGSADDLAQPGTASLPAPASTYFEGIVDEAVERKVRRLILVQGTGPFARYVANGAKSRGTERGVDSQTVDASAVESEDLEEAVLLVAGPFEHDVALVRGVRDRGQSPALLGAVAAGIPAFGQELGEAAEGVLAPVQWWPSPQTPTVGPSGTDFVTQYRHRTGREPSYPAAQAAAGYLAHAAHRQDLGFNDLPQWTPSTFFGDFSLDLTWRQVGHHVTTIRWQSGHMVPISVEDGSRSALL